MLILNVFVQKIGSDEKTRITSVTERDISGYMWANNNRILFIKDNGGDENGLGNQPAAAAAAAAAVNMVNEDIDIGGENGNSRGNEEEEEEEEKKEEEDTDNKNDDDDDDLEFVEEVSANERIRRNIANSAVINIASQSQSQSQSIMDTFSSLSQSLSQFHESQYDDSQSDDGSYCDQEDPYADDL